MTRNFIVANNEGLNVRAKPDTKTGARLRFMTNGEKFQATDIFSIGNQTWACVSHEDAFIQEYACIAIGTKIYAREQAPTTPPIFADQWALQIDSWARAHGYSGIEP
jgi:hypothetical protein